MKNIYPALVLMVLMTLSSSACAHELPAQQDNISVVGVGKVEAEPDQAILNVSISAQKPDLSSAKKLADQRYAAVLKVIKDAKISDNMVTATRITAQPQYEYRSNQQVYKGELVSRSLSIKILDLDKVSPLMQALVENGVSTIDGINTGFQDQKALLQQALAAAADDARDKAKFLAERLGRSLGSAYLISEHNSDAPQNVRRERTMASASIASDQPPPPEMFGTQTIQASVNVSFNLL